MIVPEAPTTLPARLRCRLRLGGLTPLLVLGLLLGATTASARPDLKTVRSKYYVLHSDLEDAMIADLGTRMDAMYAEYSRRLADFDLAADRKPIDVYLFDSKDDYIDFTHSRYLNTGGVFIPGKNQLAAFMDGQRDTLRRTLQHEAFHQFAYKAIGPNMPIWLNEGMAQLFEEAIWTGEGFLMNQIPQRRIRQLQSDIRMNKLLPLRTLMAMTPEKWSQNLAGDAAFGSTQYNQTWALVHFMAYGDEGRNGVKLVRMLKAIANERGGEEAFREAFGPSLDLFNIAFERHAMAMQSTAEAALIDRHEVLADLCGQLADRGKRFATVADFRRTVEQMKYRLRYTRGQLTWTAEPAAYFRDDAGKAYSGEQLFFEPHRGAVLPDLVFHHPDYRINLRARFFKTDKRIEHEVVVEGAGVTADVGR
jgi:hypothetical protein